MDKYGYTIKKNMPDGGEGQAGRRRYRKDDLEMMSTFQLREICRREKLVSGIADPLDREQLQRVILRFCGEEDCFLIRRPDENGLRAVESALRQIRLHEKQDTGAQCSSGIVAYEGLAIGCYDALTIPYDERFSNTNAFVAGGDGTLCAVLNIVPLGERTDVLYLTKAAELPCRESEVRNYRLYCMGRRESILFYRLYYGDTVSMPESMEVCGIPLPDFEVREPAELSMPIAVDFGTTNTAAGVYLDRQFFERAGLHDGENGLHADAVNYAMFYDPSDHFRETPILPGVVGVRSIEGGEAQFLFGYDAVRLANASEIDEGFCIFYDIKRWVRDYERLEEITDRMGRRKFVPRKEILKAYFEYVIREVCNRFKCRAFRVHISSPVKQKTQFLRLFEEILPEYVIEKKEMLDEGVSVLYDTVSSALESGMAGDGQLRRALIIDCGGGTTDLCSCSFRIWDRRVSYQIEIEASYENGDTDFGGNNLTYRIMQYLKIAVVNSLCPGALPPVQELLAGFDIDVFRFVDSHGTEALYQAFQDAYETAEDYLPTKFRRFGSRQDCFRVKNNFYFLFHLAERLKKRFFDRAGTLQITVSSDPVTETDTAVWIPAEKWKLSVYQNGTLKAVRDFPAVSPSVYEMELLLKGDIYGIIRRFMEPLYENGTIEEYSLIRLTGQSCRIGIFREALKEFVPGRTIRFRDERNTGADHFALKLTGIDGALKYLRDRKYGYADVSVTAKESALPYRITAFTHTGEEIELIRPLQRGGRSGMVSRNMEDLTLQLYLKDMDDKLRYQYTCHGVLTDYRETVYEEIAGAYGGHIRQDDTDDIEEKEVRFFVWQDSEEWRFYVVPVYRKDTKLYLGRKEAFCFENDGWTWNLFDGMK